MLKKLLAMFLSIFVVFSLTSCSLISHERPSPAPSSPPAESIPSDGMKSSAPSASSQNHFDENEFPQPVNLHAYEKLTKLQALVYDHIKDAVMSLSENTEDLGKDVEMADVDAAFIAFLNDNPSCFWLNKSFTLKSSALTKYIALEYTVENSEQLKTQQTELLAKLSEAQALINSGMSSFEKELVLHDWMLSSITYSQEAASDSDGKFPETYTAYGALVTKSAVCEGYSRAMQLLLHMVGIDNYLIYGEVDNNSHMWNIVEIDGEKYHLDSTWDDPQTNDGRKKITHSYFNVTDELISKSHSKFDPQNCNSTSANYFAMNNLLFSQYDEAVKEELKKAVFNAAKAESKYMEFAFSNGTIYSHAYDSLFENDEMFKIINEALKDVEDTKINSNKLSFSTKDTNTNIITIEFSFEEEE